ncbi:hypothetical protein [Rhizobium sp. Root483D2]|uniref:hypothetical protein n=1 Tax=Rhizobium sp. Root483D2 TaxID=1736545 RepID=UPI0007138DDD|nr:hypothetical protein [Rhizobium sp. Root483D2]KQY49046.1 hypothetical protein ASD32_01785 [Rhizobium sp. Root483D2]
MDLGKLEISLGPAPVNPRAAASEGQLQGIARLSPKERIELAEMQKRWGEYRLRAFMEQCADSVAVTSDMIRAASSFKP